MFLVIGRKITKKENSPGGVTILFELFLKELEANDIKYKIIDLNKRNYLLKELYFISVFIKIVFNSFDRNIRHISFHGTAKEYWVFAPFVVFISRLMQKGVSLRKFAGNFNLLYEGYGRIKRKLIEYVLRNSDINFFETKYLVKYFKKYNVNTFWFPNVRSIQQLNKNTEYAKRFVFISHVKETKGVNEILKARQQFDSSYIIDIYGPDKGFDCPKALKESFSLCYKGVLSPENVIKTLSNFDVLILPTYHDGEGYPGIIIEAFSLGIPVITTRWNAIPEIVDHMKNGILIEPKSSDELIKAIQSFNDENYKNYNQQAKKKFEQFDSKKQTETVLEIIKRYSNG